MEPKDFFDRQKQQFARAAELQAYYLATFPAGQSSADDETSKLYRLIGHPVPAELSSAPSPVHQSAGTSTYQDTYEDTTLAMTTYDPEDFYPNEKIYEEVFGRYVHMEESFWHGNLKKAIEMLNEKLGSQRLEKLDPLWHSGFDDREFRKLRRSLLTIQMVVDDVNNEGKELKVWRIQHRHLKELLCQADDILDDIALRATHLKQLLELRQVSHHPYLNDKLVELNNLIHELDTIAVEIKSAALPEFNTPWRKTPGPKNPIYQPMATSSPAPTVHKAEDRTGGMKNEQMEIPRVDEMPMFYTFVRPQGTISNRGKGEATKYGDEVIGQPYDFSSSLKEDKVRMNRAPVSMHRPDESVIYDEIPPSTSRKNRAPITMDERHDSVIYDEKPPPISRKKRATVRKDNKNDESPSHDENSPSTSSSHVSTSKTFSSINHLPQHLKRCLLYTSLFPSNYEFEKDMLVQMWIAVGYIRNEGKKPMEDTAADYFDELSSMSLFQVSTLDEPKYILRDEVYKLLREYPADEYARLEYGNLNGISKETLHSSVLYESTIDPMIFRSFHKLKGLHSLLLFGETRNGVKQIPYDLIINMRSVRVLDLSGTTLKELPSSVGDMKTLQYLDLSKTPIKSLPESISSLSKLQTLKLRDCLNFVELPKNLKSITNLRHLELDIARQLTFMPKRMGRLTNLQTLSAFIAGKGRGSQIAELKDMINLRGSLRIVKLENVFTVEDAEEAAIYDKQYLNKLELQWSLANPEAKDVLEGLEPDKNLRELEIVGYGGETFPPWLGDSSFSKLASIYMYNCKNVVLLPLLGRLPALKTLRIGEMHALEKIDEIFFRGSKTKGFSKLETLDFDGMHALEEWTGIQENAMPCLHKLTITDCPNLIRVSDLSNLKSLQHLEISLCFNLPSLAERRLPSSLQTLIITDCEKLKEGYQKEGDDWHKIADIQTIWIDYQQIS